MNRSNFEKVKNTSFAGSARKTEMVTGRENFRNRLPPSKNFCLPAEILTKK